MKVITMMQSKNLWNKKVHPRKYEGYIPSSLGGRSFPVDRQPSRQAGKLLLFYNRVTCSFLDVWIDLWH